MKYIERYSIKDCSRIFINPTSCSRSAVPFIPIKHPNCTDIFPNEVSYRVSSFGESTVFPLEQ